ncbi:sulfotransferase family protein [Ferruginivarius sediminum]|uniref:Sulfotransferase n=1 Tax=Ferruginivarius sediminum TaxID=2661937 RepID=A0A369TEN0_9PROT|nr:sulfotransferase [Ferruginivarius sediminum]RDD63718.1 sulfotransferase [Ferruginivarius sediminum]
MTRPIHPLTGADPATLFRVLMQNGSPRAKFLPALSGMVASALLRLPSTGLERAYVEVRAEARAQMPAPIFILGHWRSGTTHLFNLLSGAPGLTYAAPVPTGMPWDFLLLGRALRPLLHRAIPDERGIDAMTVTPNAPQEDEIALASMTRPSYYHGVYFPRRFREQMRRGLFFDGCTPAEVAGWQRALRLFTEKVSLNAGGRQVLIKNPAHTAKIRQLRAVWPDARFVHIVRNPYHVYQSTQRMFAALLDMVALQDWDPAEVEAVILESYPRMMDALVSDSCELASDRFIEVRFETLEADPLGTVAAIADRLGLADPEGLVSAAKRHLDSVSGYRKQTRSVPPEVAEIVEHHWGRQLEHWGYARPVANREGAGS